MFQSDGGGKKTPNWNTPSTGSHNADAQLWTDQQPTALLAGPTQTLALGSPFKPDSLSLPHHVEPQLHFISSILPLKLTYILASVLYSETYGYFFRRENYLTRNKTPYSFVPSCFFTSIPITLTDTSLLHTTDYSPFFQTVHTQSQLRVLLVPVLLPGPLSPLPPAKFLPIYSSKFHSNFISLMKD